MTVNGPHLDHQLTQYYTGLALMETVNVIHMLSDCTLSATIFNVVKLQLFIDKMCNIDTDLVLGLHIYSLLC